MTWVTIYLSKGYCSLNVIHCYFPTDVWRGQYPITAFIPGWVDHHCDNKLKELIIWNWINQGVEPEIKPNCKCVPMNYYMNMWISSILLILLCTQRERRLLSQEEECVWISNVACYCRIVKGTTGKKENFFLKVICLNSYSTHAGTSANKLIYLLASRAF